MTNPASSVRVGAADRDDNMCVCVDHCDTYTDLWGDQGCHGGDCVLDAECESAQELIRPREGTDESPF